MTTTREAWLNEAVALLSKYFHEKTGQYAPGNIRVSCGWPSIKAMSHKQRRIAECWAPEASKDGQIEIFISPILDDPIEVLSSLSHEMVHATVGNQHKHGKVFSQFGRSIGLDGKPTQMGASQAMRETVLTPMVTQLGPYPHATLDMTKCPDKKQTTRMHKVECEACGYVARVSAKWLADVGPPLCACNSEAMVVL